MDKLKSKTRSARNRLAEATSSGTGSGSLQVPQASLAPHENASTHAVDEGIIGPLAGSAARDFAVLESASVPQRVIEPPTSLQSSVDAGTSVPVPPPPPTNGHAPRISRSAPSLSTNRARSTSNPNKGSPLLSQPTVSPRQSSIGIRRMPSSNALRQVAMQNNASTHRLNAPLPALDEDQALGQLPAKSEASSLKKPEAGRFGKFRAKSPFWSSKDKGKAPEANATAPQPEDETMNYTSDMVDVLDTIDPEVATLTSLTNLQNSLFIPNLPFFNRRPTYNLRRRDSETESLEDINRVLAPVLAAEAQAQAQAQAEAENQAAPQMLRNESATTVTTLKTIDSNLSESRYAVLPHGTSLEGWSKEDKLEVNDHVRHMLHSKRSRFKRTMRGFGQYIKRPLGFLVTLYATLITLFGLAWVLFLIGWINVGGKQLYVIHIIDSVLVALFAVVGDGLAPFRAIDTYHMIYIAHYHHYTWSRRKKDQLPELHDHNDLPTENAPFGAPRTADPEDPEKQWEFTVLTPKQQEKLEHHQGKFCKSHSFYKPHETETHYAFPLRLLVAIVVLLDCHSLLQISLGACTWGIDYHVRPFALTTVILCCSITCNATAGLLIWIGDKRTRKQDVLERMNRQELTEEAIKHVEEKKKGKDSESDPEDEDAGKTKRSESKISLGKVKKFAVEKSGIGEVKSEDEAEGSNREPEKSNNDARKKEGSAYP